MEGVVGVTVWDSSVWVPGDRRVFRLRVVSDGVLERRGDFYDWASGTVALSNREKRDRPDRVVVKYREVVGYCCGWTMRWRWDKSYQSSGDHAALCLF